MSTRKTTLFYAALIAVASMAIGMVLASRLELAPASTAQALQAPPMNTAPISGTIDAQTFRTIAKAQSPIVVNIRTTSKRRGQEMTDLFGGDDFFRRFFNQPDNPQGRQSPQAPQSPQRRRNDEEETQGAGTGFIIDKSGLILTNNHVVEGTTRIEVGFFGDDDGDVYDAKIVGRDPLTDSALIELTEKPGRELPEAKFGDSNQMQPGDWVMAIGNPFNIGHSVTVGVISALERPFRVAEGRDVYMLQTDAAINPGNSGGPLLNIRGEVVGMNTAILSDRAANLGIGFAVPINQVRELLPQLRSGTVTRGRIGVQIAPLAQDMVETLGLKSRQGALVSSVIAGGAAAKGGVKAGDVITEYNGKPVKNNRELIDMVVRSRPGSAVPVTVVRDRTTRTLTVTVDALDLESERAAREQEPPADASAGFGLTLQDLTPDVARRLRLPSGSSGAVVTDVEARSAAAQAGLQPGDVITKVNGQDVETAADASRQLQRVEGERPALLLVQRGGQEVFLSMRRAQR